MCLGGTRLNCLCVFFFCFLCCELPFLLWECAERSSFLPLYLNPITPTLDRWGENLNAKLLLCFWIIRLCSRSICRLSMHYSLISFLHNPVDVCDGWVSVLGSLRNLILIKRIVHIYVFAGKFNCRSTLPLCELCIVIPAFEFLVPSRC